MQKRLIPLFIITGTTLLANDALAQSFSSLDPRSMAMGGTGVAVSRPDTATFFNPSLLSLPREGDDFALQLPYFGAKVFDPNDFDDNLDSTQDAIDALEETIDLIDGLALSSYTSTHFNNLSQDTDGVNNALNDMDQDLLYFEVGVGISGGKPSEKLGIGAFVHGRMAGSGLLNYNDSDTLADLAEDATTIAACIDVPASCTATAGDLNIITITGNIDNPVTVSVNFTPEDDLESTADVRAAAITEAGISFSHNYQGYAIGITPKYVRIDTFDYQATAESADTDDIDGDDYLESYSDFNLDVGVAKEVKENLIVGFVIKNLIEQDYETVQKDLLTGAEYRDRGGDITLSPQARVGIAYQTSWGVVAADLDLTKNNALGFEEEYQQLGIGAEFDALGFLQLRAGYKSDFEDSDRSTVSAGLGLSFLSAHVDFAVAGNGDEIGAALELGFAF